MNDHDRYGWATPQFTADPFPFYRRLQDEAPVYHVPGTNTYLVSRWADIAFVAQNGELFQQPPSFPELEPRFTADYPSIVRYSAQASVNTNGPDHKIKRAWGLRLVKRERLRAYEPHIRDIADELIDSFVDRGSCEFRWEFAEQLPAFMMMDVLGLPREDVSLFMSDELVTDPSGDNPRDRYALAAIMARLEDRSDDFLSEVLYDQIARDGAVDLNFQVAQCTNLIGAGSETTAHVLANTMTVLCHDPGLADRARQDSSLLRLVIEEAMRLETPVQWLPRVVSHDVSLHGVNIPAGATLWLLWGAGNRDPEHWPEPETFAPDRPHLAQEQLGFGRGPHLCLGAPLARLEAAIAFERLLDRLADLRVLADESDLTNVMKAPPSTRESVFDASGCMHGPKTLRIAFRRRSG